MALALGTNSGFVTVAPTADPAATGTTIDGSSVVTKHTSPAGSVRITSFGWYRASGTNAANWEIALYSDTAGVADARLFVDATNSTTSNGWVVTAVDWAISPSTAYWLGLQMDSHSGSSSVDSASSGGAGSDVRTSQTALNDPYGGGAVADADGMYAIYALVEIADTTDDLTADDVATGAPTLTSAVIGQTHALTADDATSGTPTLTSPALSEVVAITADDISTSSPTLTVAVLGQAHVLLADGVSAETPAQSSPVLTENSEGEAAEEVIGQPGGIDPARRGKKKLNIIKPLGTLHLPKKPKAQRTIVDERVEEAIAARAEIAAQLAREFGTENAELAAKLAKQPTVTTSMLQVDAEIRALLHKKMRTEDEEMMILMLVAAAAA